MKTTKTRQQSERVENYAELIKQIDSGPDRGPARCPVDGCVHKARNRHGLRVHMARKHSGKTRGRPLSVNARHEARRVQKPRPVRRQEATAHGLNFCPCCGFSLVVLRAAMSVAGGAR